MLGLPIEDVKEGGSDYHGGGLLWGTCQKGGSTGREREGGRVSGRVSEREEGGRDGGRGCKIEVAREKMVEGWRKR